MKNRVKYDLVLFAILAVLAFLPMVQKWTGMFKMEPLKGVYPSTPYPQLNLDNLRSGQYQRQLEAHAAEHIGFREPIIRLYNQYLYSCYKKTYASEIAIGKDNWLYYKQSVNDYYGTEMYNWFPDTETARATFDREARLMYKLRGVLQDYGIEFLMFMAPEKGFIYPEHLPDGIIDTTSINAREYYSAKFDKYGFPYIEMTKWFLNMKEADTLPFSLFSQSGAHWGFSSVIAADSLFRLMGSLSGEPLPTLVIGPYHESADSTQQDDRDLECNLNLIRSFRHPYDRLYDAEVTVAADATVKRPNVLFVGNSFLWRMHYYIPFDEVFSASEYWFYNSTAYYGKDYAQQAKVLDLDIVEKLMDADYVVWFTTGNQLYKMSYGFVESALVNLCLSKERLEEVRKQLMDSLAQANALESSNRGLSHQVCWNQANELILADPEHYFPELAGEGIPISRNPRIEEVRVIKDIRKDPAWMAALDDQTVIQHANLESVLQMEAQNILNGKPLLRDMEDIPLRKAYIEYLIRQKEASVQATPTQLAKIEEKAQKKGRTLEEQIQIDAAWMVHDDWEKNGMVFPNRDEIQLLLRRDAFMHSPDYDSLVDAIANSIRSNPAMMESIKEKAEKNGKTLEQQIHADARWIVNEKIDKGEVEF